MAAYPGGNENLHPPMTMEEQLQHQKELEALRREKQQKKHLQTDSRTRGAMDMPFLLLTLVILCFGVVMVYSASYASAYYESGDPTYYFVRQAVFAGLGVITLLVLAHLDYHIYRKFAFLILLVALVLLLLVPFIGEEVNEAKRWIDLGITTFQPSELAKIAVIISFAAMICNLGEERMKTIKYGILPFGGILLLIAGLLYLEPHMSATVIIFCVGGVMMFIGGVKKRWFVLLAILAVVGGYLLLTSVGYSSVRIQTWRDPWSNPQGSGWQIIQSLYSIGSGGLLGLGLGNSRQKYLYLPEEHNDFIFAVVCEELGFIGAMIVIVLFVMLILRGYWLALHARDRFGTLLVAGITTLLALQVFFNIAVVTNFIPTTGISLPFFSYGGTALIMQLAEMGIILNVSRQNPVTKQ